MLSAELVQSFYLPPVLQSLQEALWPPYKVVKLFCGVTDCDDYLTFFKDWSQWQELTNDDEPDAYLAAVKKAISEGKVRAVELLFLVGVGGGRYVVLFIFVLTLIMCFVEIEN